MDHDDDRSLSLGTEISVSVPPPSPLTGCYLLAVIGEPHTEEHKEIILQRLVKGLQSWDSNEHQVDLEKELMTLAAQAPEGEDARNGERLIQYASENLVTEILIHPQMNTLMQCMRNLLSSFTRHRHLIHAGYTAAGNGSWIVQDGTFSLADFTDAYQENEVQRVIRAYENSISIDIHCSTVGGGEWANLPTMPFVKYCKLRVNPTDILDSGSQAIKDFVGYLNPYIIPASLEQLLVSSDVVGNIRFSHPTLYVFPGGQGDAALFGINGFNMLVDGGFSRKACWWDFARHLDRLDAVMLTRVNNSSVAGMAAVLKRKAGANVYPHIGHFFCNLEERRVLASPDGDKDSDPLLVSLLQEGSDMMTDVRHLNLKPQHCWRSPDPINLYHKVGHGTLDMYVLNPSKDSKHVRDFLKKWHGSEQQLFKGPSVSGPFNFPIPNIVSICALLVWRPANPDDNVTRIMFPGSTPQHKIFEGLEKLKHLDFLQHPKCTGRQITTTPSPVPIAVHKTVKKTTTKTTKDKLSTNEKKDEKTEKESVIKTGKDRIISEKKSEKIFDASQTEKFKDETDSKNYIDNKLINELIDGEDKKIESVLREAITSRVETKLDSTSIESVTKKQEFKKKDKFITDKKIKRTEKTEDNKDATFKLEAKKAELENKSKVEIRKKIDSKVTSNITRAKSTQKTLQKVSEKKIISTTADKTSTMDKSPPSTPKKTSEIKVTKEPTPPAPARLKTKIRKQSPGSTPAKSTKEANNRRVVESKYKQASPKRELTAKSAEKKDTKVKREPISRRPRPLGSPVKAVKLMKSPTKAAKSIRIDPKLKGLQRVNYEDILKDAKKSDEENSKSIDDFKQDIDDKEEQEIVREIEAVFNRDCEVDEKVEYVGRSDIEKITCMITDAKTEATADAEFEEEYLIIEKEEIDQYTEESALEHEHQEQEDELQKHAKDKKESEKKNDATEIGSQSINVAEAMTVDTKHAESKEHSLSVDEKQDLSSEKKTSDSKNGHAKLKSILPETQQDEKVSSQITVESGATTTAPTLPEDERITLDDIKEDNQVEEKYVNEETKEIIPPKTLENIPLERKVRHVVKTPDEVADLPLHEEVDYQTFEDKKTPFDENKLLLESFEKQREIKDDDVFKRIPDVGFVHEIKVPKNLPLSSPIESATAFTDVQPIEDDVIVSTLQKPSHAELVTVTPGSAPESPMYPENKEIKDMLVGKPLDTVKEYEGSEYCFGFTEKLRETHITTVESPLKENANIVEEVSCLPDKIPSIPEDVEKEMEEAKLFDGKKSPRSPIEVEKIVASVAEVLKSDKPLEELLAVSSVSRPVDKILISGPETIIDIESERNDDTDSQNAHELSKDSQSHLEVNHILPARSATPDDGSDGTEKTVQEMNVNEQSSSMLTKDDLDLILSTTAVDSDLPEDQNTSVSELEADIPKISERKLSSTLETAKTLEKLEEKMAELRKKDDEKHDTEPETVVESDKTNNLDLSGNKGSQILPYKVKKKDNTHADATADTITFAEVPSLDKQAEEKTIVLENILSKPDLEINEKVKSPEVKTDIDSQLPVEKNEKSKESDFGSIEDSKLVSQDENKDVVDHTVIETKSEQLLSGPPLTDTDVVKLKDDKLENISEGKESSQQELHKATLQSHTPESLQESIKTGSPVKDNDDIALLEANLHIENSETSLSLLAGALETKSFKIKEGDLEIAADISTASGMKSKNASPSLTSTTNDDFITAIDNQIHISSDKSTADQEIDTISIPSNTTTDIFNQQSEIDPLLIEPKVLLTDSKEAIVLNSLATDSAAIKSDAILESGRKEIDQPASLQPLSELIITDTPTKMVEKRSNKESLKTEMIDMSVSINESASTTIQRATATLDKEHLTDESDISDLAQLATSKRKDSTAIESNNEKPCKSKDSSRSVSPAIKDDVLETFLQDESSSIYESQKTRIADIPKTDIETTSVKENLDVDSKEISLVLNVTKELHDSTSSLKESSSISFSAEPTTIKEEKQISFSESSPEVETKITPTTIAEENQIYASESSPKVGTKITEIADTFKVVTKANAKLEQGSKDSSTPVSPDTKEENLNQSVSDESRSSSPAIKEKSIDKTPQDKLTSTVNPQKPSKADDRTTTEIDIAEESKVIIKEESFIAIDGDAQTFALDSIKLTQKDIVQVSDGVKALHDSESKESSHSVSPTIKEVDIKKTSQDELTMETSKDLISTEVIVTGLKEKNLEVHDVSPILSEEPKLAKDGSSTLLEAEYSIKADICKISPEKIILEAKEESDNLSESKKSSQSPSPREVILMEQTEESELKIEHVERLICESGPTLEGPASPKESLQVTTKIEAILDSASKDSSRSVSPAIKEESMDKSSNTPDGTDLIQKSSRVGSPKTEAAIVNDINKTFVSDKSLKVDGEAAPVDHGKVSIVDESTGSKGCPDRESTLRKDSLQETKDIDPTLVQKYKDSSPIVSSVIVPEILEKPHQDELVTSELSQKTSTAGSPSSKETIIKGVSELSTKIECLTDDSSFVSEFNEQNITSPITETVNQKEPHDTMASSEGKIETAVRKDSMQIAFDVEAKHDSLSKDSSRSISPTLKEEEKPILERPNSKEEQKSSQTGSLTTEEIICEEREEKLQNDMQDNISSDKVGTTVIPDAISKTSPEMTVARKDSLQVTTDIEITLAQKSKDSSRSVSPTIQKEALIESFQVEPKTSEQSQKSSRAGSSADIETVIKESREITSRIPGSRDLSDSLYLQIGELTTMKEHHDSGSKISPEIELIDVHATRDGNSKDSSRSVSPTMVEESKESLQNKPASKEQSARESRTGSPTTAVYIADKDSDTSVTQEILRNEITDALIIEPDPNKCSKSSSPIEDSSLKIELDVDVPTPESADSEAGSEIKRESLHVTTDIDTTRARETKDSSQPDSPAIIIDDDVEYSFNDKPVSPDQSHTFSRAESPDTKEIVVQEISSSTIRKDSLETNAGNASAFLKDTEEPTKSTSPVNENSESLTIQEHEDTAKSEVGSKKESTPRKDSLQIVTEVETKRVSQSKDSSRLVSPTINEENTKESSQEKPIEMDQSQKSSRTSSPTTEKTFKGLEPAKKESLKVEGKAVHTEVAMVDSTITTATFDRESTAEKYNLQATNDVDINIAQKSKDLSLEISATIIGEEQVKSSPKKETEDVKGEAQTLEKGIKDMADKFPSPMREKITLETSLLKVDHDNTKNEEASLKMEISERKDSLHVASDVEVIHDGRSSGSRESDSLAEWEKKVPKESSIDTKSSSARSPKNDLICEDVSDVDTLTILTDTKKNSKSASPEMEISPAEFIEPSINGETNEVVPSTESSNAISEASLEISVTRKDSLQVTTDITTNLVKESTDSSRSVSATIQKETNNESSQDKPVTSGSEVKLSRTGSPTTKETVNKEEKESLKSDYISAESDIIKEHNDKTLSSPKLESTAAKKSLQVSTDDKAIPDDASKDTSPLVSPVAEITEEKSIEDELTGKDQSLKDSKGGSPITVEFITEEDTMVTREKLQDVPIKESGSQKKKTLLSGTVTPSLIETECHDEVITDQKTSVRRESLQVATDVNTACALESKESSRSTSPAIHKEIKDESSHEKYATSEKSQKLSRDGSPLSKESFIEEVNEITAIIETFELDVKNDTASGFAPIKDDTPVPQIAESVTKIESTVRKDSLQVTSDNKASHDGGSKDSSRSVSPALEEESKEKSLQDKSASQEQSPKTSRSSSPTTHELVSEKVIDVTVISQIIRADIQDTPIIEKTITSHEISDTSTIKENLVNDVQDTPSISTDSRNLSKSASPVKETLLSPKLKESIVTTESYEKVTTDESPASKISFDKKSPEEKYSLHIATDVVTTDDQESKDSCRSVSPAIQNVTEGISFQDTGATSKSADQSQKSSRAGSPTSTETVFVEDIEVSDKREPDVNNLTATVAASKESSKSSSPRREGSPITQITDSVMLVEHHNDTHSSELSSKDSISRADNIVPNIDATRDDESKASSRSVSPEIIKESNEKAVYIVESSPMKALELNVTKAANQYQSSKATETGSPANNDIREVIELTFESESFEADLKDKSEMKYEKKESSKPSSPLKVDISIPDTAKSSMINEHSGGTARKDSLQVTSDVEASHDGGSKDSSRSVSPAIVKENSEKSALTDETSSTETSELTITKTGLEITKAIKDTLQVTTDIDKTQVQDSKHSSGSISPAIQNETIEESLFANIVTYEQSKISSVTKEICSEEVSEVTTEKECVEADLKVELDIVTDNKESSPTRVDKSIPDNAKSSTIKEHLDDAASCEVDLERETFARKDNLRATYDVPASCDGVSKDSSRSVSPTIVKDRNKESALADETSPTETSVLAITKAGLEITKAIKDTLQVTTDMDPTQAQDSKYSSGSVSPAIQIETIEESLRVNIATSSGTGSPTKEIFSEEVSEADLKVKLDIATEKKESSPKRVDSPILDNAKSSTVEDHLGEICSEKIETIVRRDSLQVTSDVEYGRGGASKDSSRSVSPAFKEDTIEKSLQDKSPSQEQSPKSSRTASPTSKETIAEEVCDTFIIEKITEINIKETTANKDSLQVTSDVEIIRDGASKDTSQPVSPDSKEKTKEKSLQDKPTSQEQSPEASRTGSPSLKETIAEEVCDTSIIEKITEINIRETTANKDSLQVTSDVEISRDGVSKDSSRSVSPGIKETKEKSPRDKYASEEQSPKSSRTGSPTMQKTIAEDFRDTSVTQKIPESPLRKHSLEVTADIEAGHDGGSKDSSQSISPAIKEESKEKSLQDKPTSQEQSPKASRTASPTSKETITEEDCDTSIIKKITEINIKETTANKDSLQVTSDVEISRDGVSKDSSRSVSPGINEETKEKSPRDKSASEEQTPKSSRTGSPTMQKTIAEDFRDTSVTQKIPESPLRKHSLEVTADIEAGYDGGSKDSSRSISPAIKEESKEKSLQDKPTSQEQSPKASRTASPTSKETITEEDCDTSIIKKITEINIKETTANKDNLQVTSDVEVIHDGASRDSSQLVSPDSKEKTKEKSLQDKPTSQEQSPEASRTGSPSLKETIAEEVCDTSIIEKITEINIKETTANKVSLQVTSDVEISRDGVSEDSSRSVSPGINEETKEKCLRDKSASEEQSPKSSRTGSPTMQETIAEDVRDTSVTQKIQETTLRKHSLQFTTNIEASHDGGSKDSSWSISPAIKEESKGKSLQDKPISQEQSPGARSTGSPTLKETIAEEVFDTAIIDKITEVDIKETTANESSLQITSEFEVICDGASKDSSRPVSPAIKEDTREKSLQDKLTSLELSPEACSIGGPINKKISIGEVSVVNAEKEDFKADLNDDSAIATVSKECSKPSSPIKVDSSIPKIATSSMINEHPEEDASSAVGLKIEITTRKDSLQITSDVEVSHDDGSKNSSRSVSPAIKEEDKKDKPASQELSLKASEISSLAKKIGSKVTAEQESKLANANETKESSKPSSPTKADLSIPDNRNSLTVEEHLGEICSEKIETTARKDSLQVTSDVEASRDGGSKDSSRSVSPAFKEEGKEESLKFKSATEEQSPKSSSTGSEIEESPLSAQLRELSIKAESSTLKSSTSKIIQDEEISVQKDRLKVDTDITVAQEFKDSSRSLSPAIQKDTKETSFHDADLPIESSKLSSKREETSEKLANPISLDTLNSSEEGLASPPLAGEDDNYVINAKMGGSTQSVIVGAKLAFIDEQKEVLQMDDSIRVTNDEIDASDEVSIALNQSDHKIDETVQTKDIPPTECKTMKTVQVFSDEPSSKTTEYEIQVPRIDKEKLDSSSESIDTVDHRSYPVNVVSSEKKMTKDLQINQKEQSPVKTASLDIATCAESQLDNNTSELKDKIEKDTSSSYGEAGHEYDTESSTKELTHTELSSDSHMIVEKATGEIDDQNKALVSENIRATEEASTNEKVSFEDQVIKTTLLKDEYETEQSQREKTSYERTKREALLTDDDGYEIEEKNMKEFSTLQVSSDKFLKSSDFVSSGNTSIISEVKPSNGHVPVDLDTTYVCKDVMEDNFQPEKETAIHKSIDSQKSHESSSQSIDVSETVKESNQKISESLTGLTLITSSVTFANVESDHTQQTNIQMLEKKTANGHVQHEENEQEESISYMSMKSDLDSYDSMTLQDQDLAQALKDEQFDTLAHDTDLSHKIYSEETNSMQKSFVSLFESTLKEDSESIHTLASSSEDISKEISCEEKHSFECLEKESKKHSQRHDFFTSSTMKTEIDSSHRESISTRTAHAESGSPKDISLSITTDSGIMSLQADNKLGPFEGADYTQTLKDNAMNLMESVSKAFSEDSVQQGIKTESVDSLIVRSEFERVSTPPTVPVSPLPKTPSSAQDLKVTDGIQSELTFNKSDGAEETITKVVHVGDDILTQKISTSTEKAAKTTKETAENDESDLTSLMHSMGKIKTETDTVTKIIKEGVNVVTQTITTVTTKEIISREDGTPQNVKTTIETTTLSKGSDGSTTTVKDTQTLLSECSSSLKSTSQMDLYAKDIKLDKEYLDTSEDKSESLSSQISDKEISLSLDSSSTGIKNEQAIPLRSEFITTVDDDSDDNIEDTVIDTDVSKKIIKEGGLDIVETVITTTKKEVLKVDNTKKIIRTTTETNITKERPDGSKDTQKNVDVKSEEIKNDSKLPKGEAQIISSDKNIVQPIKSSTNQVYSSVNLNLESTETKRFENEFDRKSTLSSVKDTLEEIGDKSVANDVPVEQVLEGFTKLEDQTVNIDTQEQTVSRDGVLIKQMITITTTREILASADGSKKKLKTTIETVTESKLPNGTTEVVKDVKISIADYGMEIVGEKLEGYHCVGEPDEQTASHIEEIIENDIKITRKTTTTTIRQEFENIKSRIRKIKTIVRTVIEDEHPNGTVFTKKSEKTSIADVFLTTPQSKSGELQISDAYTDHSEVVEDVSEDTDVKSETIQKENQTIIRTVTTKTKRETLNTSDATVKRIRTTIETITVDEYPNGATETTKDVKITVSETQTTSDSQLQSALAGLESTGKIKTSVDKKHGIVVLDGEEVTQTITTKITKEEFKCTNTDEIAIKTVTETITETAKKDGSIEIARDLQTQITYLPHGTTLDDLTEEHLEVIEKPTVSDHISLESPLQQKVTIPISKGRSPTIGEPISDTEVFKKHMNENGVDIEQTVTVVTTKELISPDKVKTTVETTTVNKGSDGVTKTLKATKTTFSDLEEKYGTGESEKSFSKTDDLRSSSAASDDLAHGFGSPPSDLSSRESKATHAWGTESSGLYYSDEDGPGSPSSTKSQIAHSPRSNLSFELEPSKTLGMETSFYKDPMSSSVYAQLPEELPHEVKTEKTITKLTHEFLTHEKLRAAENIQDEKVSDASFLTEADEHFNKAIEEHKKVSGSEVIGNITAKYDLNLVQSTSHQETKFEESQIVLQDIMSDAKKVTESASSSTSTSKEEKNTEESKTSSESTTITTSKDPIESWGKPLGLPSPIMPPTQSDGKSTPKKQNPMLNKNKLNPDKIKEARKSSESPSKRKPPAPVYLELTYVPHHGNSYYSAVEFFKRVRARYYVFSGTEPSKEIYNALLDAKKTWEDKDLEVTIIPTYDTDVLGYWVTENEDALEKYKIDLSPSASRCTINLQDHETSCAAYRLEF